MSLEMSVKEPQSGRPRPRTEGFVSLSVDKQDNNLYRLSIGDAEIKICKLNIMPMANMRTPYMVYGIGDACIKITPKQMLQIMAEWIRLTCPDPVEVTKECTSLYFHVNVKK